MATLLEKAGSTVSYNTNQTCCGQPAYNAGFWNESKEVCAKFIKDFAGTDHTCCTQCLLCWICKEHYPTLFDNSSVHNNVKDLQKRIFEFSEFLVDILHIEDFGAVLNGKATYHDSCAALRECKIKEAPRKLLAKVKGLEMVEMKDVQTCCGFGGTFSVKFEPISISMAY